MSMAVALWLGVADTLPLFACFVVPQALLTVFLLAAILRQRKNRTRDSGSMRLWPLPFARCDHVVFGYSFSYGIAAGLVPVLGAWLRLPGKRRNVFMLQNEYQLFQPKLGMAARLSCAYVTNQLCLDSATRLYAGASRAASCPCPTP